MVYRAHLLLPLLAFVAAVLFACATLRPEYPLPKVHPEELGGGPPLCSDCHEEDDETLDFRWHDHTATHLDEHRFKAYQNERLCSMCHQQSFCNECHVTRVELKPSLRRQGDTYRRLPHRGDYLSRHRIDGRVDPTSCFRCHGNPKSSKTCAPCHG